MKITSMLVVCSSLALVPAAFAQRWEFGGAVGGGFYTSQDVTNPTGSASAKVQSNFIGSAWLGNSGRGRWGGEIRFDYQMGDLHLSKGSQSASFSGNSYAVHYDVLYHFAETEARVRPFVSAGAGIKVYRGTGAEQVFQPLSDFALLTKDQDLTPLASVGAGVKVNLSQHAQVRLEIHDYFTSFPNKVIAPAAGAKVGGWIQDFVPMVGIAYTF
jgi:Outer membrane protein beta-barrel domain